MLDVETPRFGVGDVGILSISDDDFIVGNP